MRPVAKKQEGSPWLRALFCRKLWRLGPRHLLGLRKRKSKGIKRTSIGFKRKSKGHRKDIKGNQKEDKRNQRGTWIGFKRKAKGIRNVQNLAIGPSMGPKRFFFFKLGKPATTQTSRIILTFCPPKTSCAIYDGQIARNNTWCGCFRYFVFWVAPTIFQTV